MIDLKFRNRLGSGSSWPSGNSYNYEDKKYLDNILFSRTNGLIPYFMTSDKIEDKTRMVYSAAEQFGGKTINMEKLKSIMKGAEVPLILNYYGGYKFIAAKGFLGIWNEKEESFIPLFMALVPPRQKTTRIGQVTYTVSREIYKNYSFLGPVVDHMIKHHAEGQTFIMDDITSFLGATIDIPAFKTLGERGVYIKQLIDDCWDNIRTGN